MKLLRLIYPLIIILFAWSVCVTMISLLEGEEQAALFFFLREYYMVPLLLCNLLIILTTLDLNLNKHGRNSIIILWLVLILLFYLLVSPFKFREVIEISLWPTSYLASYALVRKRPQYLDVLKCTFLIVYILGLCYFIIAKFLQQGLSSLGIEAASNVIFCIITVVPFMLLFKSKPFVLITIVVTLIVVVF